MVTVYRRAAARRDLVAHFVYLTQNAGDAIAERFLSNAEASFNDLATQPMIGAPLTLTHTALSGIRKWRVKAFGNYLISTSHTRRVCPSCGCCTGRRTGCACWVLRINKRRKRFPFCPALDGVG